jgi:CRISPR system Cascade subunit CasE
VTALYLSRARLRASRGEALAAIAPLLIPDGTKQQAGHAHRILWLLFQDIPDAKRDFLWRDEGGGRYLILSKRPPSDPMGVFELEAQPFEANLKRGDRLRFMMRANPVVTTKRAGSKMGANGKSRGKRVDIVMDALHTVQRGEARRIVRDQLVTEKGSLWLAAQGERAGFILTRPPVIDGYTQVAVERKRGRPAGFSVLDLAGEIAIVDPSAFLSKLTRGFGSAKAFGCGLMLIRRVKPLQSRHV